MQNESTSDGSERRRPAARRWIRRGAAITGLTVAVLFIVGRAGPGLSGALCGPWAFQQWMLLLICVPLLLIERDRLLALALAPVLIWQSAIVVPGLVASRPATQRTGDDESLRIVSSNVFCSNRPTDEAIEWFRRIDADLLVVIEDTPEWERALSSLHERFPFRVDAAMPGADGMGLFSRFPLRDVAVQNDRLEACSSISAIVDLPGGRPLRLIAAHPIAPISADAVTLRNAALERMALAAAEGNMPAVLIGDFNDTPYGEGVASVSKTGLRSAREGFGRVPTWPARLPGRLRPLVIPSPLRIAIDHCYVTADVTVLDFRSGSPIGSDHLPIVADVAVGR